jgi:hypothetical protein
MASLLESIRGSKTRLVDLTNQRSSLLREPASPEDIEALVGEARDARLDHEVAVNKLYDLIGMVDAVGKFGITHWADWPLEGASDEDEIDKVEGALPDPVAEADASSSPRASPDLPAALLEQLKNSADDEIEAAVDSAKGAVEECHQKLNAINVEGRRISEQIRKLTERQDKLKHEKRQLTQDRNLQALFLERAQDEQVRRRSESEKALGQSLLPSVHRSPRHQLGSDRQGPKQ